MTKNRKTLYSLFIIATLAIGFIISTQLISPQLDSAIAQTDDRVYVHDVTGGPWAPFHMDYVPPTVDPIHLDFEDTPAGPVHMDFMGTSFDPYAPLTTWWHEIYPYYSNEWHLTSWLDNGDGYLSPSDQIDMAPPTGGPVSWYHVDKIVTTIWWTEKPSGDLGCADSVEPYIYEPIFQPITTFWHQIWPTYCHELHITSWEDNGDGYLSESDQVDFMNYSSGTIQWVHIDRVTVDLILTPKGPVDWVTTDWHELYPDYTKYYHLDDWRDNGDSDLSPSDQIWLYDTATATYDWYHVDHVTPTIWLTDKTDPSIEVALESISAFTTTTPVTSLWHEVYPIYSHNLHLAAWQDNGDGVLSASDQVQMFNYTDDSYTWWHVEKINRDIIVTKKPDPIPDPITTMWHELYPTFSQMWHLSSWRDNGDGVLSPSDQIDMYNEQSGEIFWFHVERITTTIHWTEKQTPTVGAMEPWPDQDVNPGEPITDPISTYWHQIYPTYSHELHITSWDDNGDGVLSASDQIDITDLDGTGEPFWVHIDKITINIILTPKKPIAHPISSDWLTLHPKFDHYLHLFEWEDNGDDILSPSDKVHMLNQTDQTSAWFHVDEILPTLYLTSKYITPPEIKYIEWLPPQNFSDPIVPRFHEVYPTFCVDYQVVNWIDNGDGIVSPSDQIELLDIIRQTTSWWHINEISTDMILGEPKYFPWDVAPLPDGDGYVGIDDIVAVAEHFGQDPQHPDWDPRYDMNGDDYVGIDDIVEVAEHFGQYDP